VKSFSNECILETLLCDENVGIDYIEVGYEFPNCITSSKIKTVVMVDAKNIRPVSKLTNCVRVASYPNQIHTAIEAVENFKSQGFEVFLHLMTADKFEDYQLLKNWKHKDILTSIYFADTFGAFMPKDVENIYKKLQDCGFEQISFHAHNNLQLAFANTIKAMELGAYCVDATVFGLGRGGGNLPLELLLRYLDKDNQEYIELIKKYYLDNPCVYSYKNMISGLKNLHPSQAIV
jgi:4-hydroxy 2-oxovalerate aldolase